MSLHKLSIIVAGTPLAILDSHGWRDSSFGQVLPWRLIRRCELSRRRQSLVFELVAKAHEDPAWPFSFHAPDYLRLDLRDAAKAENCIEMAAVYSSLWIRSAPSLVNLEIIKQDKSAVVRKQLTFGVTATALLMPLMWGVLLLRPFPDEPKIKVDLHAFRPSPLQDVPAWPPSHPVGRAYHDK